MVSGVRLLTINSPPYNPLTKAVREKLSADLHSLVIDSTCAIILLVSTGLTFSVGADVKELASSSHGLSELDAIRAYVAAYQDHNVIETFLSVLFFSLPLSSLVFRPVRLSSLPLSSRLLSSLVFTSVVFSSVPFTSLFSSLPASL